MAELLMHWTCNLVTHWIPALYKKPTGLRLPVGILQELYVYFSHCKVLQGSDRNSAWQSVIIIIIIIIVIIIIIIIIIITIIEIPVSYSS